MSSFKEILSNILNNTEVTIDKNGIGIKNGNFNINIPGGTQSQPVVDCSHQSLTTIDEYKVRCVGISGIYDLFGGIHFTALIAKDSVLNGNIDNLWKRIPDLYSTASTDLSGNRIRLLRGDDIIILAVEIPCQVYNHDTFENALGKNAVGIIKDHWTNSISETLRFPMNDIPNADEHVKRIGEFLSSLYEHGGCQTGTDTVWSTSMNHLCLYFAEIGRSHIGTDIANYENLTYVPEVPKGRDMDFMKKHSMFFDNQDNMNRCVKLKLLQLMMQSEGRF